MCEVLEKLRNKLIVSVQALPGNPLRDTYCIAHLAAAAAAGGAAKRASPPPKPVPILWRPP